MTRASLIHVRWVEARWKLITNSFQCEILFQTISAVYMQTGPSFMHRILYVPKWVSVDNKQMQGCIQDFCQGGRTWSMSKRGGARLFVAAGQPQGGGCIWKFKGGQE